MPDLGVIILAAGGSTRMGQPKQLLKINGQTLIQKTTETALAVAAGPVVVVLGNARVEIEEEIWDLAVTIASNPDWKKGMASSFRIGVRTLKKLTPHLKSVLILLCDQPLITSAYLKKLYESFLDQGQPAIASAYGGVNGVPAIFEFDLLSHFISGDGDFGARPLIKELEKKKKLAVLSFPGGAIDLDTQADYEQFLKNFNSKVD